MTKTMDSAPQHHEPNSKLLPGSPALLGRPKSDRMSPPGVLAPQEHHSLASVFFPRIVFLLGGGIRQSNVFVAYLC
jgi:hypothetical protein